MKKVDAIFRLWYDKLERLSYDIGDNNGAFSEVTIRDLEAMLTLVYVSAKTSIYREPAKDLIALFSICNPDGRFVDDDERKQYYRLLKYMNKLAAEIQEPPIVPPSSENEED